MLLEYTGWRLVKKGLESQNERHGMNLTGKREPAWQVGVTFDKSKSHQVRSSGAPETGIMQKSTYTVNLW